MADGAGGNGETGFAAYLRAVGVPVYETRSARWYADSAVSLLNSPPGAAIAPSLDELRQVMRRARKPILRYVTDAAGVEWQRITCRATDYSLESLAPKARNQTRRGLERTQVRRLTAAELRDEGMSLNQQTWSRQDRRPLFARRRWPRICAAAEAGVIRAWGAVGEAGRLLSLAITVDDSRIRHVILQSSSQEGLRSYANNALVFELTRDSLGSGECAEVSFGLRGFVDDAGLDHFKLGMGYRLENIGMRVVIARGLRVPLLFLARPPLSLAVRALSSDLPRKLDTLLSMAAARTSDRRAGRG